MSRFDVADHLDDEERIESFLDDARRECDPKYLDHAEKIALRARILNDLGYATGTLSREVVGIMLRHLQDERFPNNVVYRWGDRGEIRVDGNLDIESVASEISAVADRMQLQRDDRYRAAIKQVVEGYQERFATSIDPEIRQLLVFMAEIVQGCEEEMPVAKLNRWLGYVQGVLIARRHLSVEEERDATRPLFRPLDYPAGEKP